MTRFHATNPAVTGIPITELIWGYRMSHMARTHCAVQLLKHGELTFIEFVEITGWTAIQCRRVIEKLQKSEQIFTSSKRGGRSVYSLVAMRELVAA